jgi:hypothetical protein
LADFKTATASCVLAALDGARHAVMDTRVWTPLEQQGYLKGQGEFRPADYVTLIKLIREIAAQAGLTPVEVGYTLFENLIGHCAKLRCDRRI